MEFLLVTVNFNWLSFLIGVRMLLCSFSFFIKSKTSKLIKTLFRFCTDHHFFMKRWLCESQLRPCFFFVLYVFFPSEKCKCHMIWSLLMIKILSKIWPTSEISFCSSIYFFKPTKMLPVNPITSGHKVPPSVTQERNMET